MSVKKAIEELESQIIQLDCQIDAKLNFVKVSRKQHTNAQEEYRKLCDKKVECEGAIKQLKGVKPPAIIEKFT